LSPRQAFLSAIGGVFDCGRGEIDLVSLSLNAALARQDRRESCDFLRNTEPRKTHT